jgi:MGT family glycosyltransferase
MNNFLYGKKILFANVPTDGHFDPLTGLAKHLQHNGCDVRWYTSEMFSKKLERLQILHYPFVKAKDLNGKNLHSEIPDIANAEGGNKGKLYLKHLFIDRATEYFEDIKDIYDKFPFDVLITDNMFSAMPFVRYMLHVPVVSIGVVPLLEDSIDVAPAGRALPPAENDEVRFAYQELYKQKYSSIAELIEQYRADLKKYHITVKGSFVFDTLVKEANIHLQIGIPQLEYPRRDLGKNVTFIGALRPYRVVSGKARWFDSKLREYSKVILVTQGTVEGNTSKILEPAIAAFAGTDSLIIATTGGSGTAQLRDKYTGKNVIIEDHITFDDVMPYVSVFITNGGYGGTIMSIMHGVPMVMAGIHELKNEVCARIAYVGIGIDLKTETPTPDAIFEAAQRILTDFSYKERVLKTRDENGLL